MVYIKYPQFLFLYQCLLFHAPSVHNTYPRLHNGVLVLEGHPMGLVNSPTVSHYTYLCTHVCES